MTWGIANQSYDDPFTDFATGGGVPGIETLAGGFDPFTAGASVLSGLLSGQQAAPSTAVSQTGHVSVGGLNTPAAPLPFLGGAPGNDSFVDKVVLGVAVTAVVGVIILVLKK